VPTTRGPALGAGRAHLLQVIAQGSSSSAVMRRGRRWLSRGCRCWRTAAWRNVFVRRGRTARRRSGSVRTSLGPGVVRPQGARIDWACLLKRVFLAGCARLPVWRPAPNRERGARALGRDRDRRASGVAHRAASARTGAGPSPDGVGVRGGAAAAEGALAGATRRGAGGGAPSTGGGGARGHARAP
jgi:hypothetical protein